MGPPKPEGLRRSRVRARGCLYRYSQHLRTETASAKRMFTRRPGRRSMSNWPWSWPCFPTLTLEPPRSKLRGKSRRSSSPPSPSQRNCHPVVWAAVANQHVSPRYEKQTNVGLQLVVKMENYKFSNWECLREFEICPSHDAELCPWHREIWHSARGSDWRKSNCLLFLPYQAETVLWITQLPTNKHYKCIHQWKLGSITANIKAPSQWWSMPKITGWRKDN